VCHGAQDALRLTARERAATFPLDMSLRSRGSALALAPRDRPLRLAGRKRACFPLR